MFASHRAYENDDEREHGEGEDAVEDRRKSERQQAPATEYQSRLLSGLCPVSPHVLHDVVHGEDDEPLHHQRRLHHPEHVLGHLVYVAPKIDRLRCDHDHEARR